MFLRFARIVNALFLGLLTVGALICLYDGLITWTVVLWSATLAQQGYSLWRRKRRQAPTTLS